ncbi:16S rRNA (cytosine(967)-C(5))-methyltransferase RsmB [Thiohalobacter sp. IOR34]|uniref:16S rRNA (cytosine(967)-C(5))-methyltransferase RsmB n=1 Tax=Thiohalobacter sp. IOR34 TaxID=3057176 RepID=UPI00339D7692
MNARRAAAAALGQVLDGRSLTTALPPLLAEVEPRERPFAQEMAYGVVRWQPRLSALLARLLQRPLKRKDRDVEWLLLVGLYQLLYLEVKPYAAVHASVEAVREAGKGWAAKLVNAVLRNAQRRAAELLAEVDAEPAARLAHPEWLLRRLRGDWPEDWAVIAEANNRRPPMCLRVNARQMERDGYLQALAAAGIEAAPLAIGDQGVVLAQPQSVERLPGFAEGRVSVQDGAAQLAAPLLDAGAGMRVLDACAAPGGKTAHILEREPRLARLLAIDAEAGRLADLEANLARLGLAAETRVADAARPADWWDGEPFERILLDVPCSATGVIRRHPDIKLLRREADIEALLKAQARLLDSLWPLLAPGGLLLYATCSVLRDENERQVTAFLARTPDARELPLDGVGWGRPQAAGRQILPGEGQPPGGLDGFYYARLLKQRP